MTIWLNAGIIFTLLAITIILLKWGNVRVVGVTPVKTLLL
jgi:glycine betaine transporter|tara:strand:- start:86 stop:205 length:120 start_codon:yes stop_codon:yes gene_type:complete